MSASILHTISAAIYVFAYGSATVYAQLNDLHRDMCPIYAAITLAALLHLIVVIMQKRGEPDKGTDRTPPAAGRAPITSAKRITYYDHLGEPYMTEWVKIPEPVPAIIASGHQEVANNDGEENQARAA